MTDPLADMLTRVRNANAASLETTQCPVSKEKLAIASILESEGYIEGFETEGEGVKRVIRIRLKYGPDRERMLSGLRRVSKPGCRVYASANKLPKVMGGLGIAIISTSSGVMTDRQARRLKVGGEVIAYVW
jgi:small subunit ribosomal protein S8